MKFKISNGAASLSFDGDATEARMILDDFWKLVEVSDKVTDSVAPASDTTVVQRQNKPTPKRAKRKSNVSGAAANSKAQVTIDPQKLANEIKSHHHFTAVKSKIIDKKGEWLNKCKMVGYFASEPITSGDVKRLMDVFRLKCNLPTVSNTLSNNTSEFLTEGDNPVKYDLTGPAREEFEKWLKSTDD